jgi:hypothetical protein
MLRGQRKLADLNSASLHRLIRDRATRYEVQPDASIFIPSSPGPPCGTLFQSIDLAVQEHPPATSRETPAQILSCALSQTYASTLPLTILSPTACFQTVTLVTMTPSSHSDVRHLEADAFSEQSRVLAYLANDLQYAASILNHKASDLESRSTAVRKSIWEDVENVLGCTTISQEEQNRIKQMIENVSTFMEVAFRTKHGLKQVIETACANHGYGETDNNQTSAPTDPLDGTTDVAAPSLENQIDRELTQARRVFTDASAFIPVNFNTVATLTRPANRTGLTTPQAPTRPTQKRCLDMSPCPDANVAPQYMLLNSPPPRGRSPGSKNNPK